MFEGRLPSFANTRSLRVAGGLGTIPRIVGDSQEIYAGRLPAEVAIGRIESLYKPYHRALRQLLGASVSQFGWTILADCHSMPSAAVGSDSRADVVIGDRYGTSCSEIVTDVVEGLFAAHGLRVVRNRPYAGGFITEHYGQPALERHAVQIEVCRAIYLDERRLEPNGGFQALSRIFTMLAMELAAIPRESLGMQRVAAE
jgi:N-formylglutamate amidohydrolase